MYISAPIHTDNIAIAVTPRDSPSGSNLPSAATTIAIITKTPATIRSMTPAFIACCPANFVTAINPAIRAISTPTTTKGAAIDFRSILDNCLIDVAININAKEIASIAIPACAAY